MGCAASTPADCPADHVFDVSLADTQDLPANRAATTVVVDLRASLDDERRRNSVSYEGQLPGNPLLCSWPSPVISTSRIVGTANASLTDSKFMPGAERSDSRTLFVDGFTSLEGIHPDPALRDRADGAAQCAAAAECNHAASVSQPRIGPVTNDFRSSSSGISKQSAGSSGVICPEPPAREWSVMLARKRAVAEFHGHTADPDQYGTASVDDFVRSTARMASHDACVAWLRDGGVLY